MTDLAPATLYDPTYWFEDFALGQACRAGGAPGENPAPAKTITVAPEEHPGNDAHFLFFAGPTGDNHPIHYDPMPDMSAYAKGTRFGVRRAGGAPSTQRPTASSSSPTRPPEPQP